MVAVGVGVGVGALYEVAMMLSMLIRFVPPEIFLTSKRTAAEELTVKLAVESEAELEVTVEPTFVQVEPLLLDFQSSQVLEPSVP